MKTRIPIPGRRATHNKPLTILALAAGLAFALSSPGQTIKTWTGGDGDFYLNSNWDTATIPGVTDIAVINNGATATIGASAGTNDLGALRLGDIEAGAESGHVVMNGGHLNIGGTLGDPKAVIGFSAAFSTFVMNGGTIFFDGPDMFPGSTTDDGLNGLDWEVGERGLGRFEMHNNAVFRAGDDLKVGASATGMGSVLIDGNAWLSVGSGVSVSEGGPNPVEQLMVVAGNARVDAGNSMGAGNPLGSTDEGYLTMAAATDSTGRLVVQDDAVFNFRRLSARQGNSIITVRNRGQMHIFDVLNGTGGSAANRPAETGPNSTLASHDPSFGIITLQDDAQMTVNSDPAGGPTKGLAISGPRDAGNSGGTAFLVVRDRASFSAAQDLALGTGAADTSDGTLEVVGPDATVNIGGNLSLAVDLDGNPTPGRGTLSAVITGPTHSTVVVTNIGRIANGHLKVTLSGYAPVGGESYTLIRAASFDGQFLSTNLTAAPLGAGLSWDLQYNSTSIVLRVTGIAIGPRVITVTSTNTTDIPGLTNLSQAILALQDGDVIRFNIPGLPGQVHYLPSPPGGFPIITKDNVMIDGYSQPGASPNSNPISAANNAQIRIVLDARNGNYRDMEYTAFGTAVTSSPPIDNSSMSTERGGYGAPEKAILGVYRATNANIRGVAFLGTFEEGNYGIAVAHDYGLDTEVKDRLAYDAGSSRNCHINGCWFGIDPANPTVAGLAPFQDGIAFFRHRDVSGGPRPELPNESLIVGVKPGSANPRAEFNVIAYMVYGMAGEAVRTRFSGNFLGVLPDGVTPTGIPPVFNGGIEIGRYDDTEPIVIGTDGDGVNDADEGNLFGPLADSGVVLAFYSTGNKPYIVAGNRFGIGVDGTRWPNSQVIWDEISNLTRAQFGSDFDGVSDALEANHVYNNHPPGSVPFYPTFIVLNAGAALSVRGNTLVNNFTPPVDPTANGGQLVLDYYAKAVADTNNGIVPVLSTNSTTARLIGSVPLRGATYPVMILDVYLADPEGITNGIAAGTPEGYVQGKTYLGSFAVDGTGDLNLAPGQFEFDITSLNVAANATLTAAANYSKEAIGTRHAATVTSLFAAPVAVNAAPGGAITIGPLVRQGAVLNISWTGGTAPFQLQTNASANLATGSWGNYGPSLTTNSTTVPITPSVPQTYIRVVGQ